MTRRETRVDHSGDTTAILEELLDAIPLLISLFDMHGNPYRLNAAAKAALAASGLSPGELLTCDLVGGIHHLAQQAGAPAARVTSERFGSTFLVAVGSVTTSHGDFYAHIAGDITVVQKDARELDHRKKMNALGSFAGRMAHDFSNILSGILGYASLLLEESRISAGQQKALEAIRQSAERGEALVTRLRSLSATDLRTAELVDVNRVVLDVITVLSETLPKGIRVIPELASDLPRIIGDRLALLRLILNLATNAKEALDEQGTIIVRTYLQTDDEVSFVRLEVEDDGAGMSADTLEHMYEPFYSTRADGKKRGLGLAVVYSVVKSHGGTISCSSDPALGTTFTVTFPADGVRRRPDDRSPSSPLGRGEHR